MVNFKNSLTFSKIWGDGPPNPMVADPMIYLCNGIVACFYFKQSYTMIDTVTIAIRKRNIHVHDNL